MQQMLGAMEQNGWSTQKTGWSTQKIYITKLTSGEVASELKIQTRIERLSGVGVGFGLSISLATGFAPPVIDTAAATPIANFAAALHDMRKRAVVEAGGAGDETLPLDGAPPDDRDQRGSNSPVPAHKDTAARASPAKRIDDEHARKLASHEAAREMITREFDKQLTESEFLVQEEKAQKMEKSSFANHCLTLLRFHLLVQLALSHACEVSAVFVAALFIRLLQAVEDRGRAVRDDHALQDSARLFLVAFEEKQERPSFWQTPRPPSDWGDPSLYRLEYGMCILSGWKSFQKGIVPIMP
jgi:hypothetical protein